MRLPGRELDSLLGASLPDDGARQTLAERYIEREVGRPAGRPWRVLDLGCGPGDSVDAFRARDPAVQWLGLDVEHPHLRPTRTDARFEVFDGRTIPCPDASFDLVFCKQVLEHVRRPGELLGEVRRVLVPGGYLAGSTSQLEPFHTLSFWNYTPLGFVELVGGAGLEPVELRAGVDALTLIARRLVPRGPLSDRLWARWWARESPLNGAIGRYARLCGWSPRTENATKLLFAGQFAFLVRRPVEP